MFMETRFSSMVDNELDVRPSRELHEGKAPLGVGCSTCKSEHPDTAGVSSIPLIRRLIRRQSGSAIPLPIPIRM